MEEGGCALNIFRNTPKRKRPYGKLKHRWNNISKTNLENKWQCDELDLFS
jgi:hypothetical protein